MANEHYNDDDVEYLKQFLGNKLVENSLKASDSENNNDEFLYHLVKIRLDYMREKTDEKNKWWLSDDEKIIAVNQYYCNFLLVSFSKFRNGMESLVQRHILDRELVIHPNEFLEEEMRIAKNGGKPPEELAAKSREYAMNELAKIVKKPNQLVVTN